MEKLPCGHDDDFAHALTVVFGMHLLRNPDVIVNGTWHNMQSSLITNIRDLFKMVGAEMPSVEALTAAPAPTAPTSFKVPGNETSH